MSAHGWTSESVFHEGDSFFKSMNADIRSARFQIDFDYYIFASDSTGELIFSELVAARARGVKVRIIVDGVGSSGWRSHYQKSAGEAGIEFQIYHELPFEQILKYDSWLKFQKRTNKILKKVNRRNHHKICLIDKKILYTGSFNISSCHASEFSAVDCWRDTGVKLKGPAVRVAQELFETIWHRKQKTWRVQIFAKASCWAKTNHTFALRRHALKEICTHIARAHEHAWITTPYFAPDFQILKALKQAAKNKVDVRLLMPARSDVTWAPWISRTYFLDLLKSGVKIYLYDLSILHAKIMAVDDWVVIGSTNLNHRSLIRDLEFDVRLKSSDVQTEIKMQFLSDLECSTEITVKTLDQDPQWKKWAGEILFRFRYLL